MTAGGASAPEMAARLGARQAALYEAEARSVSPLGRRWRRLAEAQGYVDGLIGGDWFGLRWPHLVRCTVERRGSGARWSTFQALDGDGPGGSATEGVLLLAPGGLDQPTVLHELAHLVLPTGVGHARPFAEVLLALVRHEMGFFAYADLRRELRRIDAFSGVDSYTAAG